MPSIHVTTRAGITSTIQAPGGQSLMETLRAAGFEEIVALCGGSCSCGTCHIYIDASDLARLPAMPDEEDDLLSCSDHRKASSRLSCQIKFGADLDGIAVTIAPED